ncbi:MAG: carboxylating nicotinate-nucleotide diphosphorylase [Gammaproteobacteria bacterium]
MNPPKTLPADIASTVRRALSEDIGTGDLTAELIPAGKMGKATVISREQAVFCGRAWFDEVFRQLDKSVQTHWAFQEGSEISADQVVCTLQGPARVLLSGERTALNFLQLLSGTATITREYAALLGDNRVRLLDTRKTIPGLRTAQKYAVACGGGHNHRMGLYDAILIKENHIQAAGGILAAVQHARSLHRNVELEVEDLEQMRQAIEAGADTILLDNFSVDELYEAVKLNQGRACLEVSGGVNKELLRSLAATGVDCISVGALTKNVRAIDFSMRMV